MSAQIQQVGKCSHCDGEAVTCKYNHFQAGDLVIHSWEHKCPDCGRRETTGYRTDDPDSIPPDVDPRICPYCGRTGTV